MDDTGAFAALSFRYPDVYLGRTLEIAGDELTPLQISEALGKITGPTIPYVEIPMETFRHHNKILASVFQWISDGGHKVDILDVRKSYPPLMDFDAWINKQGKAKFEALF
ncbi:hypothetical protein WMW72_04120 [Paenibacillus filicis]|uniref:NmrA-like domain-containing protein n=1 Tax=Paenibacillus filicis TaxID=669464 RepID=A0ABU9DG23_9BACL